METQSDCRKSLILKIEAGGGRKVKEIVEEKKGEKGNFQDFRNKKKDKTKPYPAREVGI